MLESSAVMADTFCTVLSVWRVKFKFIKQTGQSPWPHFQVLSGHVCGGGHSGPHSSSMLCGLFGGTMDNISLSPTNLNFLSFVWWLCHFYNV